MSVVRSAVALVLFLFAVGVLLIYLGVDGRRHIRGRVVLKSRAGRPRPAAEPSFALESRGAAIAAPPVYGGVSPAPPPTPAPPPSPPAEAASPVVAQSKASGWRAAFHIARPVATGRIYQPIWVTIQEGFEALGLTMADPPIYYPETTCQLMADVKEAVQQRHVVPVVVALGWQTPSEPPSGCTFQEALKEVGSLGYLILYNSEPKIEKLVSALKVAKNFGAKEVWSHTASVMKIWQSRNSFGLTLRLVPPGCASALRYNVRLDAETRDDNKIAFMGNWAGRNDRMSLRRALGDTLQVAMGLWSDEDYRKFLEKYPLQMNINAKWNQALALESPRIAQMATNGACVLSTRRNPEDEKKWNGTVTFVENKALVATFRSMAGKTAEIRACQESAQRTFCSRFQPLQIMKDSGFVDIIHSTLGLDPPK